jgi:hypothetical protein
MLSFWYRLRDEALVVDEIVRLLSDEMIVRSH